MSIERTYRVARWSATLAMGIAASLLAIACGDSDKRDPNVPPKVEQLTADLRTLPPGGQTSLEVRASDPDASSGTGVQATWRVSGEAWSIESDGTSATVTAPDSYRSWTTLTVEVTDSKGATATATLELTTGQNAIPRVTTLEAVPNPVEPGGTVELKAEATDARGDEVSYAWSAPAEWSLSSGQGPQVELQAPDSEGARARVTLTVTDGFEGKVDRTVLVETAEDRRPRINSMFASPPQVERGGTIAVQVDAVDPEGTDLSYDWSAPTGWSIEGSGSKIDLKAPDAYGKRGTVSVEVTDARDQSVTGRVSVSTETNSGPIIQGVSADSRQVAPGGKLNVTVNATDPNGDTLGYNWRVGKVAWSIAANGSQATVTASNHPGQSTSVTVEVTDAEGETARASILLSVAPNERPQIVAVSAKPSRMAPGGTSTLSASAKDPDGGKLSYSWTVSNPWAITGSGSDVKLKAPGQFGAQAVVRLKVEDAFGAVDRGSVRVATTSNSNPVINSLSANPPTVSPGGTSTVRAMAADPEGDTLSYSWSVPKPWSEKSTGKSNTVDVVAPKKANASVQVEVRVDDGHGGRTRGTVVVRTPLNQPPVIKKVDAKKTTLEPGESTTIDAKAVDPDGDPVSYDWNLPSSWTGNSAGDSITVTAPRTYGKTFKIRLEATDGLSTATKSVSLQTVGNQSPVVKSFSIKPNPVDAGSRATATVDASDPLGDSLTYKWTISNKTWGLNGSGKSVKLQSPNKKSTTTVTVSVRDGFGGGVTKKKTVKARTALFSFSSHRFTSCGSSGGRGPTESDCENSYNPKWASDDQLYWMDNRGIQKWRVPQDGRYRIVAAGAEGGGDRNDEAKPGEGAVIRGTFQLIKGDVLKILVGQKGETSKKSSHPFGAGGGGTFVTDANNAPLIVAGGGSGSNGTCAGNPGRGKTNASDDDGSDEHSTRCGGAGFSHSNSGDCSLGRIESFTAGGEVRGQGCPAATGGRNNDICGGFGGGGLVEWHGEGGGGGYHGGRGDDCGGSGSSNASGGTSFNKGSNQSNQTGGNTGHGYVTITKK
ncbi:MAG: Ig-like domain-containing protein [Bradymonadaceae bacterium]